MAFQNVGPGMIYPFPAFPNGHGFIAAGTVKTMDATGEKAALIGHIEWADRGTHTISAAGGRISFRTGAITWANAGTSLDIGIQGVSSTAGPPARPDGTWMVKATLVPGTKAMSANTWNQYTMGTGSATIATGDLIAVVLDMTARGGTDSVTWYTLSYTQPGRPLPNVFLTAWASTVQSDVPVCYIIADDGTLGVIYSPFTFTFGTAASESFNDTSFPDERGLLFTPAAPMKAAGFLGFVGGNGAAANWGLTLYSSPTTSPTALFTAVPVLGEQHAAAAGKLSYIHTPDVTLAAGTQYCLAVKSAGTTNITMQGIALPDAGLRAFIAGTTTIVKATRDGGSGAFTAESPALTLYGIGMVVRQLDDGVGGGGGLLVHPGMRGGFV